MLYPSRTKKLLLTSVFSLRTACLLIVTLILASGSVTIGNAFEPANTFHNIDVTNTGVRVPESPLTARSIDSSVFDAGSNLDVEQKIYRNQYGAVIRDSEGTRINYSKEQLEEQRLHAQGADATVQTFATETSPLTNPDAAWSYAVFGAGIGISNIIISSNGAVPEIYAGGSSAAFGGNAYWYALRYNSTTHEYDQVYVSTLFTQGVRRMRVANVTGDSANEIVVASGNGQIVIYNQANKTVLKTFSTAANDLYGLELADVDGDGAIELILTTSNHLYVYSGDGMLKWDVAGVGGYGVVAGQMDGDPALELATTDGHIVDSATHSSQWFWSYGFGNRVAVSDFDGDGLQELIVSEYGFVWAYDVDRQLPKWSISQAVDAMLVTDIDGDGHPELLVGQNQWGSIVAYDPVTQLQKWSIPNPEHGVTNIAVGDVDGDGQTELLWGAGASSSGPDHLYVVNWQTKVTKWQNIDLVGPFVGPEIGDLDGDGRDELVVISFQSDASYSSGRILVFDAATHRLRSISAPTMGGAGWTGIHDLKLRDVNHDGKLEILVASSFTYDGVIEIYSFNAANQFALQWTNSTHPSEAFYCVDAADVDNDGDVEIVGGSGGYLYVYSFATGNEEWHTLYMRGTPTALQIADVNHDGTREIIGMVRSGDVYVFDGPSRALETILIGPFVSMRVQDVGGVLSIVLGNPSGYLVMDRYSSGVFTETYRQKLVTTSVDGFTIDSNDNVWIASPGVYYDNPETLTEVTLGGTILATYSGYGNTFGLRRAYVPPALMFFTTGSFSVVGFTSCTAGLSTTAQVVTAAGGSGSVDVTADSSCEWGAVSDVPWASITSGSGNGNGVVQYTIAPNSGPVARSASLTIAGNTFIIMQGAAFLDVPSDYIFYDAIQRLSAHGITGGCGSGNYCPQSPVTREQMAAFIIRALGEENPPRPSVQRFTDVPPSNPFYAYIDRMAVLGITSGCGGTSYCPSAPVTREQMAVFIVRALGEFNPPPPASQRFDDVLPGSQFYAFIDRMAVLQVTFGCSASPPLYCPSDSVTRAQMAAFLVRAFRL